MNQEVPVVPALLGLIAGFFLSGLVDGTVGSSLIIGACVGGAVGLAQALKMRRLRNESLLTGRGADAVSIGDGETDPAGLAVRSKVGWLFRVLAFLVFVAGSFALWAVWNPSSPVADSNISDKLGPTAVIGSLTLFMGYVAMVGRIGSSNLAGRLALRPSELKSVARSFGTPGRSKLAFLKGEEIPSRLRDLFGEAITEWPTGRIGTHSLAKHSDCGFLKKIDIELTRSDEEIDADHRMLREFAENESTRDTFRLSKGSTTDHPINLPWLDVENILCIGGGADHGDDVWLVLDLGHGNAEFPVLANEWIHGQKSRCHWREVAPSLNEFVATLMKKPTPGFGDSLQGIHRD